MTNGTRIVLAQRPHGEPKDSDFRFEDFELPEPTDGEVSLQTLHLSLDPYMRGRMSAAKSYAPPLEIGDTMDGAAVSRVLKSATDEFAPGDIVLGSPGWQTHSIAKAKHLRVLDPKAAPPSTALGVLGMPGFTAYSGLLTIGKPQPGETVVVAAAAGPVGATVGQIAKLKGAKAVGIAGGPEKVAYLTEELGFDAAIDHHAADFTEQLAAATPDGIDVYFENVGGRVFDAVLPLMNLYGRIPLCGLVANYNLTSLPDGPDRSGQLMSAILVKSLTIRGFIQNEFTADQTPRFLEEVGDWVADGTLKYREDITAGFDNTPDAFRGMLAGRNFGKTIVHVAD